MLKAEILNGASGLSDMSGDAARAAVRKLGSARIQILKKELASLSENCPLISEN
jgi:hypothetical protein